MFYVFSLRRTLRYETVLSTESPLKIMKNAFYFTSNALLLSRYLSFCLDVLVEYQNGLIKKIMLILQPGLQTIVIHILLNISRSKGNQTMKFGQLIECNMRNIFLKKSYTKCGGKTSPRPFSEKFKFTISPNQWSKVIQFVFIIWQVEGC